MKIFKNKNLLISDILVIFYIIFDIENNAKLICNFISKQYTINKEEFIVDYHNVGKKIREIREKELKQSREKFAEEIGISIHTANRLENATGKVSNIEIYLKISEITGYTIEELLVDKNNSKDREKIRRKIDYMLNVIPIEELEYICTFIKQFIQFNHRKELNTLKNIKNKKK